MVTIASLADIAAHGNRGHAGSGPNWLHCADGFTLSVIAGGGTYCQPRPAYCLCQLGAERVYPPLLHWEVPHDFPGPYTHVEVMVDDPGPDWEPYDADGVYSRVPVALVEQLIAAHGGCVAVTDSQQGATSTPTPGRRRNSARPARVRPVSDHD